MAEEEVKFIPARRSGKGVVSIRFTPDMIREMRARIEEWKNDPQGVLSFFSEKRLMAFQILGHLIENPPPGRSGGATLLQAIREFHTIGADMEDAYAKVLEARGDEKGSPRAARPAARGRKRKRSSSKAPGASGKVE